MKQIEWKVALDEDMKLVIAEHAIGFPQDKLESHLTIIGILEDLKQKHMDLIKTFAQETRKI